jgi:hypothetical protein
MADVIDINDFRNSPDVSVDLNFIGVKFVDLNGQKMTLVHHLTVLSGQVIPTIEKVREEGGAYLPGDGVMWFMPWPPAAIRITVSTD